MLPMAVLMTTPSSTGSMWFNCPVSSNTMTAVERVRVTPPVSAAAPAFLLLCLLGLRSLLLLLVVFSPSSVTFIQFVHRLVCTIIIIRRLA